MIDTERLKIVPCTREHLDLLSLSEAKLAEHLRVDLADKWLLFPESVAYSIKMIDADLRALVWGMHLLIHKAEDKLIGCGGYKGAPDADGIVEFGYSVAPAYENQGLATEAAKAFINKAFADESVKMVDAHTLAEWNASTSILQKCGLTKIAEKHDPEDGDIWHWRLPRDEFQTDPAKF